MIEAKCLLVRSGKSIFFVIKIQLSDKISKKYKILSAKFTS